MTAAPRLTLLAALLAPAAAAAQAVPDAAPPPSDASAPDPARDAARGHFQRGVELIEQERWADAIQELERAQALRVTPAVLYNLGLSYRAVGRNREAMGAFRAFGRTAGPAGDPALAARVEAYVRELAAGLGRLDVQVEPAGARVRVDGAIVDARDVLEVDPGRHVVAVEAEGFVGESRTVDVARGAQATVALRLVPASAASARVVVRAEPAGALVRIDGRDVGFGAVEETVGPGTHTLEVSAAGHAGFRRSFEARPGQTQTIRAVLTPQRSVLSSPWLWVGVAAVAAGVGVAIYFLTSDLEPPYRGTLGNVTDAVTVRF
ncbi:MAG: PEGA domain-containing protein [Polyangiales bacterium]